MFVTKNSKYLSKICLHRVGKCDTLSPYLIIFSFHNFFNIFIPMKNKIVAAVIALAIVSAIFVLVFSVKVLVPVYISIGLVFWLLQDTGWKKNAVLKIVGFLAFCGTFIWAFEVTSGVGIFFTIFGTFVFAAFSEAFSNAWNDDREAAAKYSAARAAR